ncbi:hypothetical protein AAJ76_259000473 [Vairimorpha ceranae]|uniref:Uncharacterized protein n=1 Tax=Vairimorpha ceranae TaxID=40302 RepID=A0A0F9Z735_9MICR|nr:hypothetical protein AAJ76_259000473 [Vairimorpha ceranae]KKO73729.1 hypothetical protein AAJ76_259000473 [Vairimorpha ceranae]
MLILYKNFRAILKGLSMSTHDYLNVVVPLVNDKIVIENSKEYIIFII